MATVRRPGPARRGRLSSTAGWGLAFSVPFILGIVGLTAFPLVWSAYLSFTNYDGFNPPQWTGVANWIQLLHDPAVLAAFRNVGFVALIFVPLQTIVGLGLALLINTKIRAKAFFRSVYFLPAISPWLAIGIMWLALFNPEFGVINQVLQALHLPTSQWLQSPNWWVFQGVVALANTWKGVGYAIVLFVAGLQAIPNDLLEAAEVDGAGTARRLWHITLPMLSPSTFMVLVLTTIAAAQIFDPILVFSGGHATGAPEQTVPSMLLYLQAFSQSHLGYANTIAWALFIVLAVFILLQRMLEQRWVHYAE